MLRFKKRSRVPKPGAFFYKHPDTGVELTASSWDALLFKVQQYHIANDFPIPVDFNERVEDNAARITLAKGGPEWVEEAGKPAVPLTAVKTWVGVQQIVRGTLAIAQNILRGGERVEQGEAERRANICASCQFNVKPDDCKSCNRALVERTIRRVVGNASTSLDSRLQSCWWCGCFLKAAVWWPLDILQQWQSDDTNAQLPAFCWKKKGSQ